jgi:hypothetical protein
VADLEREPLERRGDERERCEEFGVAVPRDDLRGDGIRFEVEALAGDSLDLGIGCCIRPDRSGELSDAHSLERSSQADPSAVELERPARELEPERHRFRMDTVRAPDRQRAPVLVRALDDGRECAVQPVAKEIACHSKLQSESGVEDIRRCEAEVEPTPVLAELLRDCVDERGQVMVRAAFDLRDALGRRRDGRRAHALDNIRRHRSQLGAGLERRQLDPEPGFELELVRPDARHRRTGVTADHCVDSR